MNLASSLRITRFIVRAQPQRDLRIESHAGSLLRGVFGSALRHLVCLTDAPTCTGCSMRRECLYSYYLETPIAPGGIARSISSGAPHPWLIEPPVGQSQWVAGSDFVFSFVLFGRAHDTLAYGLLAFRRALYQGLGPQRVPLEITGIRQEGEAEWSALEGFTPSPPAPVEPPPAPRAVRLELETPLRVVRRQNPLRPEELRFVDFFSTLQRRLGFLERLHEGVSSDWDYRAGREWAETCIWEGEDLSWLDQSRHSYRQGQSMIWGGVLGRYWLRDFPEALWAVLYRGQWTHAGKNASFGLGKYRLFWE